MRPAASRIAIQRLRHRAAGPAAACARRDACAMAALLHGSPAMARGMTRPHAAPLSFRPMLIHLLPGHRPRAHPAAPSASAGIPAPARHALAAVLTGPPQPVAAAAVKPRSLPAVSSSAAHRRGQRQGFQPRGQQCGEPRGAIFRHHAAQQAGRGCARAAMHAASGAAPATPRWRSRRNSSSRVSAGASAASRRSRSTVSKSGSMRSMKRCVGGSAARGSARLPVSRSSCSRRCGPMRRARPARGRRSSSPRQVTPMLRRRVQLVLGPAQVLQRQWREPALQSGLAGDAAVAARARQQHRSQWRGRHAPAAAAAGTRRAVRAARHAGRRTVAGCRPVPAAAHRATRWPRAR